MKKLLVMTLAVFALTACKRTTPGALVDPALSGLVPGDTTMLVGIRVEDLLKTPLYKKYVADRPIPQLETFSKQFGIDPRKDLWEVLFISNGKENVVLGRGRFPSEPEKRLEIELKGAPRSVYHGYTLIGDEDAAVVILGESLAVAGPVAGLKRIIDTRNKSNGPPAVLAARMKEIPVTAGFWSVYAGTPISLPPNTPANMNNMVKILNSIQSGAFYLDLHTNVSGKATGITASDAGAKELHDSLRGLLGLGRLMGAKDDVKMQRLFDGLRITLDGRNVNLYIEEQEDAITTLMDLVNRGIGQGRPAGPARVQPLK
ncbi:MAG: hypothetical protein ABIR70_09200 [Bryobacteraceae bacterium]